MTVKTDILSALKGHTTAEDTLATKYGNLVKILNSALKTAKGREHIIDALYSLADDMDAKAGNPFHKLRSTLGNRCTPCVGVKAVNEDGELINFELSDKKKGKKKGKASKGPVEKEAAYDQLVGALTKRGTEWLEAILKFDAKMIRKAVMDAKRDASKR